jgi:hypothetical protein
MAVQKPRKPTASQEPTHYQVLMVDKAVDDEVLTAVYRRMMQRARLADLEDDRRAQVLRVLDEAYAVLHDPDRRRRYDQLLAGRSDGTARQAAIAVATARTTVPVAPPSPSTAVSARVLDFGRYAGWSLRQVALRDPNYLEWLRRTPGGRQYQTEIVAVLTAR